MPRTTTPPLRKHIPQAFARPRIGTRRQLSMHPEDHDRLTVIAEALGVSLPIAIVTLMNHLEHSGDANGTS